MKMKNVALQLAEIKYLKIYIYIYIYILYVFFSSSKNSFMLLFNYNNPRFHTKICAHTWLVNETFVIF